MYITHTKHGNFTLEEIYYVMKMYFLKSSLLNQAQKCLLQFLFIFLMLPFTAGKEYPISTETLNLKNKQTNTHFIEKKPVLVEVVSDLQFGILHVVI